MSTLSGKLLSKSLLGALFGIIAIFSISAHAKTEIEKGISQNIMQTMDTLLIMLDENKAQYKKDADLFYHDLDKELSKIIDFRRVAFKVMGKHGRKASKQEREQFVSVFKRSLYTAYANVLLDNTNVKANVLSSNINSRNPNKAKVNLEISSATGAKYEVVYSMHRGKDKAYKIENIIVMGINIGLAFRDQFQQQLQQHKGDIQSVINNWSSKGVA